MPHFITSNKKLNQLTLVSNINNKYRHGISTWSSRQLLLSFWYVTIVSSRLSDQDSVLKKGPENKDGSKRTRNNDEVRWTTVNTNNHVHKTSDNKALKGTFDFTQNDIKYEHIVFIISTPNYIYIFVSHILVQHWKLRAFSGAFHHILWFSSTSLQLNKLHPLRKSVRCSWNIRKM